MQERDAILKKKAEPQVEILPPEELDKLDGIIDKYGGRAGYLIPALKEAQDLFGYLPMEVQRKLRTA